MLNLTKATGKGEQLAYDAYKTFYKTLIISKILFVSENDLEFLRVFNRKLKENGVKQAILGENIHEYNCKVEYFIPKKNRIFKRPNIESKSRSQKNYFTRIV
jgi:hypothetical protein